MTIYSTTDQQGITIMAYETEINSVHIQQALASSFIKSGNQLKATYSDLISDYDSGANNSNNIGIF